MKTAIVYYSRSGNTAKVVHALADSLTADVLEITCPRYRSGIFSYLAAGYDSVRGRLPSVHVPPGDLDGYDLVILAAPIWTSYPAVPLRAFLEPKPPLPGRIALVLTSGGHSEPHKAVEMVEDLLGRALEDTLLVPGGEVARPDLQARVDTFARKLLDKGVSAPNHP